MTDKAANRTMDAVEASLPIADRLNDNIQLVLPNWNALMSREMSVDSSSLCVTNWMISLRLLNLMPINYGNC